jgi:subtilisin family serine protease
VRNGVRGLSLLLALTIAMLSGGAAARPVAVDPLQPSLAETSGEIRPGELLVELHQPDRAGLLARRHGASVAGRAGPRVQRLSVPPGEERARAAVLRREPEVRAAAPNYVRRAQVLPDDPLYPSQWALPQIGMPSAWDVTLGVDSISIAILDSGADLDHPDLAPKLLPGANTLGADPAAPVRCPPTSDARDDFSAGHGTHVTGIAGAAPSNGLGVAGVAWRPKVIPVKVLDCLGEGTDAQVIAGIDWAIANGARVINLSVGGPGQSEVLDAAIERAHGAGIVVIAAAGNAGTDIPFYPAASPFAIAVGASDSADRPASFSNRGSHLAVIAPGVAILSTFPGSSYQYKSGTSMASPHVAGLAALLLTLHPDWPPTRVADLIRTTADKVTACPAGVAECPYDANGHTQWHGYGRINAAAALCAALATPGAAPAAKAGALQFGQPHRLLLPVLPHGPLCL